jgi:hypothetical protein
MAKPKPESKVIEEPKKPYEMTPLEVEAAQRVNGRLKGRPSRTSDRARAARNGRVRQDARGIHPHWRGGARRSPGERVGSAGQEMEDAP